MPRHEQPPNEIKDFAKQALEFSKEKPKTLDEIWPWGLRLVALLRPIAKVSGDFQSEILYDQLEQACKDKDEARFDDALIKLNEAKKAEAQRAYRMVKGGVRLFVRPFTNVIRKALGKKKLKGTKGL